MSWPYVAQDPSGGWYGDCEGVMQNGDPNRTQVEAMQWCMDRLAYKLGQARHGCEKQLPPCLLHQERFDDLVLQVMREQMVEDGIEPATVYQDNRVISQYENWRQRKFTRKSPV